MSITASARAEPPLVPSSVPCFPEVAKDVRMFSTLVAVSDEHASQVRLNTPLEMLAGFHESKKLAGKFSKSVHCRHALGNFVTLETDIEGNEIKLSHLNQVDCKLVALDVSNSGNDVRLSQPCHADLKSVPLETSKDGKDVRLLQFRHALLKFVTLEAFKDGKEVRLVQSYHAL